MRSWKNSGFSVNADVRIESTNRVGLKRLIRYCARPAFSDNQLSIESETRVRFERSKPGVKGETAVLLSPAELIDKLAQLIPKSRRHRHHYHQALAPNSRYRKSIVSYACQNLPEVLDDPKPPSAKEKLNRDAKVKIRYLWAILLSRVYELMPMLCGKCGGEMRIISFVNDQTSIHQILNYLELPLDAPALSPARGPPPEYDQVDIEFDELPEENIDQSITW